MKKLLPTLAACTAIVAGTADAATIVELDDASTGFQGIVVNNDGDSVVTAPQSTRPGPYYVRMRSTTSQVDLFYRTYMQFNVSSLTAAQVNDPGFSATLTVEQTFNSNSAEISILVGANDEGAWNTTSSTPEYAWASTSEDTVTLEDNTDGGVAGDTHTVDVTTIVQNWVNGVYDNEGFAFYAGIGGTKTTANQNNIWSFGDPTLTLTIPDVVPEPGSLALMGLGGLFVLRRRRG